MNSVGSHFALGIGMSRTPRCSLFDFALVRHTFANLCEVRAVLLLSLILSGCHTTKPEPTTVSYLRLGWSQPDDLPEMESLLQQFTRETGIRVRDLPVPETTLDQLDLSRRLLRQAAAGPDALAVDVIWAGVLQPDLVDLQREVADEFPLLGPQLLRSYQADGKLAAVPYTVQVGVLQYRRDLLREYGYQRPPRTWDELEKMAARIQAGERAKGHKDFWGYVWQGAAAEALTCNAIEWQAAAGGGRIIESNRTISVNNPAAIRSWERAKHWIGWISPPSVLAYQELDSLNVFDKGGAAFGRIWGGASITHIALFRQMHWRNSLAQSITGYTTIPGGLTGGAGTLGGSGLAVSEHSSHRKEAIELVRFLIRAQIHSNQVDERAVVDRAGSHGADSASEAGRTSEAVIRTKLVVRPSTETGTQYEHVARAYFDAVHSVLTGEKSASIAAAALEKELVRITGLPVGPPLKGD
jgi:trehalose/maltose transport system substrate-binding protein